MLFVYSLYLLNVHCLFNLLFSSSNSDPARLRHQYQYDTATLESTESLAQIENELRPQSSYISELTAQFMVHYASIAYCPKEKIEQWDCWYCTNGTGKDLEKPTFVENRFTSTEGYIGVQSSIRSIIVSFRGTSNVIDWLSNANYSLTGFDTKAAKGIQLHSGYMVKANSIKDAIRQNLEKYMAEFPDYHVVFTGHSLGGALAAILLFEFADENIVPWNRTNLVTFGQPQVGNLAWADFMDEKLKRSLRVTNEGDEIPNLPQSEGYVHIENHLNLLPDGTSKRCDGTLFHVHCGGTLSNLYHLAMPTKGRHNTYWGKRLNNDCKDSYNR